MGLTADDKKIFRKYLTEQANRAKVMVQLRANERTAQVREADKKTPIPVDARKSFAKLITLADAFQKEKDVFNKTFKNITITTDGTGYYDNNTVSRDFPEGGHNAKLKWDKESDGARIRLAEIQTDLVTALEIIDDETAIAQLSIIAEDAPGIEAQLKALAKRFEALAAAI